jgi:hypothetical protein
MTVLTVNNLPAATHSETVRCLFAIELSGMSWVIAFNTPLSEKISRRTLIGCMVSGCTGNLQRAAYAITLSIQQACR